MDTDGTLYMKYNDLTLSLTPSSEILNNIKKNPVFTHMLEHVTSVQGQEYLVHIWNKFHTPDIDVNEYCKRNDTIGNPEKFSYGPLLTCSPSSLRYIFHAQMILKHAIACGMKSISIVEVGCGYGGLLLAIDSFAKKIGVEITEYSLIDIPGPLNLQKIYLSKHTVGFPYSFHNASDFGKDIQKGKFLISNYCFSEISTENQKGYVEHLFPKCEHGFIAWNAIDLYDFGKVCRVEEEYPKTGPKNKYVYF